MRTAVLAYYIANSLNFLPKVVTVKVVKTS